MNLQAFLSILSIFAISSLLFGSVAFATNDPDNITLNQHCTVTINGENVGDNAIQSAIDASASGSTICLDADCIS